MQNVIAIADKNYKTAQESYVKQYNKYSKHKEFNVGDLVLVLLPTSTNKLVAEWTGPGVIVEVISPFSYRISLNNGAVRILHANRLRKYVARVDMVGVIDDKGDDLGEIQACPNVNATSEEEIIKQINELNLTHLTDNQALQLRNLLLKFKHIFNYRLDTCRTACHRVNLVEGFKPKAMHPYRIPEALKPEVDKQIQQLLEDGKIRKSTSPVAHPVVCVIKPDSSVRLCANLRFMNSYTIFDHFPLPNIEDVMLKVCPAKFITILDATSGFWQVPVLESDAWKLSFVTHSGQYGWLVVPFGAKTATANYSRVMEEILRPHREYAANYVDDTS